MKAIVCPACQRELYCKTNGAYVIEHAGTVPGPYKIYLGDLWACRGCGIEVVAGMSPMAIAEHWQAEFKTFLQRARQSGKAVECFQVGRSAV